MSARIRQAFTLIELLVVIAIISILATISLPVLSAARARADDAKCMNNLDKIGKALYNFATGDGRMKFPRGTGGSFSGPQNNLLNDLQYILPATNPVWFCSRYVKHDSIDTTSEIAAKRIGYYYWGFSSAYASGLDMNAKTNEWIAQGYKYMTVSSTGTNRLPLVLMSDRFPNPVTFQYHVGRKYDAAETDKGTFAFVREGGVLKISLERQ